MMDTTNDSDTSVNVYNTLSTTIDELTEKIESEKYKEESDGQSFPARLVDHYICRSVCYDLMSESEADANCLADLDIDICLKLTKDHPMGDQYVAKRLEKASNYLLKRLDQLFGYKRPILADKVVNDSQVVMASTAKAVDNCSADLELYGDCWGQSTSSGPKMTDDGRNGSNVDHNDNKEAVASDDNDSDYRPPVKRVKPLKKTFVCDYNNCRRSYESNDSLIKHVKTHEGQRFFCDFIDCVQHYSDLKSLNRHMKTNNHVFGQRYKCYVFGCDEYFQEKYELEAHIPTHPISDRFNQRHDKTIDGKIKCTFTGCDKKFNNSDNMLKHKRIHLGLKNICKINGCGQTFALKTYLNSHQMIRHPKDLPDKPWLYCTHNGCQFKTKYRPYLTQHLNSEHKLQNVNQIPDKSGSAVSPSRHTKTPTTTDEDSYLDSDVDTDLDNDVDTDVDTDVDMN